MPKPVTSTARRVLIFAWTLVLSVPVVAFSVAFSMRDIAAFQIAGETSDRWAAIAGATLRNAPSIEHGLSAADAHALADALAGGGPVRYFVADASGAVVHASAADDIGKTMTADGLAKVSAEGRLRSRADLLTGAALPYAVAESAFPIRDGDSIRAIAAVRMDRSQLYNDIFRLTKIGLSTVSGIIVLIGTLVTYQLARHFRERAAIENRTRHDREVMDLALTAADAGYFERDPNDESVRWSPRMKEILGYPETFEPAANFFNGLIHPDDAAMMLKHIMALRTHGLPFTAETRVRHASGATMWLRIHVVTQKDDAGKVIRVVGLLRDVSYDRQTRDALAASEAKFRNLIEGSIQGIVVYDNFKPLFCNDAYARLLGYETRAELLALPSLLIHVDPAVRAKADKLWEMALAGTFDSQPARRRFIDRHGAEKWLLTIGNLIDWDGRKALLVTAVDATDAVKAEQGLRESEARFRALVESSADLVTVRRLTGELEYASPSAQAITGYTLAELRTAPIEQTVHPDDIDSIYSTNQWMRENPGRTAPALTYRFRRKSGEWVWLERISTAVPTAGPHDIPRFISVARDITRRVERENALREARDKLQVRTDELTAMTHTVEAEREKAERANAAKSRFLAVMSHELRTPMAGILAATDLLQQKPAPADPDRIVATIAGSARMLLRHLNDILDMSKIESGQFDIERAPFSPRRVVAEVEALFALASATRGNRLAAIIDPNVPEAIVGDGQRYRQVLINLVDNANKFTLQGRIEIGLRCHDNGGDKLELLTEVRDSGTGITAEDAAKLFQPFVQVGATRSGAVGGTGLGLTICKSLVELMGGSIELRSSPGHGASFRFTIATALASGTPKSAAQAPASALLTRGLKLLLADDNETNRMLYAAVLGRSGHSVTTAVDGAEAVRQAEQDAFDAVLMDIQMPVMNGRDAIIAIRSGPGPNADAPIIALTADAFAENHGSYLAAGADAVITKPVDWPTLADTLARLTSGDAAQSPPVKRVGPGDLPDFDASVVDVLRASVAPSSFAGIMASMGPNLERYGRDITGSLAAGDLTAARRAAHALKGLSSQFGLQAVARVAMAIEERSSSLDDARRHAGPLDELIAAARKAIQTHVADARRTGP